MKTPLPYTYRDKTTIQSAEYKERVKTEIQRLKEKPGSKEAMIRLEAILGERTTTSDEFEISTFTSTDNRQIYFSSWKTQTPNNIFIFLNGLESHAGWLSPIAGEFAKNNIITYGLDRRGSGLNTRIKGKYQNWIDDVTELTKIAKKKHPTAKSHLVSICFGAKLATACAIQNPKQYDSLIYMSPGLSVKVNTSLKENMLIVFDILPAISFNIRSPIKQDKMFTVHPEALYFLYSDKLRTYSPRACDFFQAMMIDRFVKKNLNNQTTASLVLFAGKDRVVNNDKTKEMLAKFAHRPKIIEYPSSEHVIFFGPSKNRLISDIIRFTNTPHHE